jgi:hypothetical protein
MAAALAAGLLLVAASTARGQELPIPQRLTVAGGNGWHGVNDFDVSWSNPPGAEVVGATWAISPPGYPGGAQFVAGAGIAELDDLRVPAAGEWKLTLWLRGADGVDSETLAAVTPLRLDDVAPSVSFMPGDAEALPPQLVAAVSDPLSGIADGTISYRRLDEDRWAELPTQIRAGAFGTELAAATPELKPGTAYLFQAEAIDGAGNLGTTVLRADGAPMSFRAPPAGGSGSGAVGQSRPTRLLLGLGGSRGGGRSRPKLTVDSGEAVVLRGRLSDADGGLSGRRLRVVSRPAGGARGGVEVESVTSGERGRFELRLPAGPSRRIAVLFAGGEGLGPVRRRVALRVRGALTLQASQPRLRTGGLLLLNGRVGSRGARIPHSGKLVTISYWEREARRWRPVIVTRTDRAGRFHAGYRFRYLTGSARIRLRATAPAESEWPYAPGSSSPVTVEVRDR